ncbi:FAD-linked oxidase C-terminal domain-containing protein [Usitatibacter palustris]|uniref:Putative FAD-linked oxidoreductase n=1 Tax=Usitatibacter palustris TaxID=2732487 RepID=A0A6M4H314_9PROT|nr:FAD-linked oxidase C-terminal domain-containing protein [Usitatibacter palustris]QJR13971.1 putative FAD-linked oxidoreductase [Usitatibacter palustris]
MRSELARALASVVPPPTVLDDEESLRPFETDAFIMRRALPLLAAIPDSEAQVPGIIRACRERGVPVVTRGAGTGISGGAIPHEQGALLVMARMRNILSVDALARTAVVEPGVRNLAVSEAAAPHGLFYAPDPSSQSVCSIGGNVAENSGGVHCLKYGFTTQNICALRAYDGTGERLDLGSEALDAPGYDLMALMTGSEGNLGVITRITVRLVPLPEATETLLATFPSVRAAAEAVGEIIGAGIIPAALEMMDRIVIDACEQFMGLGFPKDGEALLLVEVDGGREDVDDAFARLRSILETCGAIEIRAANDERERAELWRARKGAFTALANIHPDYYTIDGTIPRRCLADVLDRTVALAKEYGLVVGNVFHAGDGNIHPCIFYDASVPGDLEKSEALGARVLEICIEVGGTITGEHGVGIEKLRQMCQQFRAPEIAAFHAVKHAFDPEGILNPGKAVPTLKRCAEWGGMHVRSGAIPHPEIPRF